MQTKDAHYRRPRAAVLCAQASEKFERKIREAATTALGYSGCMTALSNPSAAIGPDRAAYASEAARWQALAARDVRADGAFIYAVRSTGIYCRPGCPSRLPKRANTLFFDSPQAAEQEGFRPCLRCRPQAVAPAAAMVARICEVIDARLHERVTLADLAAAVALSPWHLQRLFRQTLGVTPRQYQQARRLAHFKQSLQQGASVAAAGFDAGFSSSSRMYAGARGLGMRPSAYRSKGQGMAIYYSVAHTPLGWVLVAASDLGICRIALGDDAQGLETELRREFAYADIRRDEAALQAHVETVCAYLAGRARRLDLPLDIRATAFRRRVWELLQAIPYGETRSYTEIAEQLGNPKSVRAVANACAANPLALAIPCHRVLQKGGKLAGFRWGLERKAALLEGERQEVQRDCGDGSSEC